MKKKCACLLDKVNVTKKICNHLLGKQHTIMHRMIIGIIILGVGIGVAEIFTSIPIIHFVTKGTGGIIEAVGVVPFIEYAGDLSITEEVEDLT